MGNPLILAVDPGSKACGIALVIGVHARVQYLRCNAIPADRKGFHAALDWAGRQAGDPVTIVAIEKPSGFVNDRFRGPTLMQTAYVAGGIAWLAAELGYEVIEASASEARKLVLGSAQPRVGVGKAKKGDMDRLVKAALPGHVIGMPKSSNVHERDALLIAVAANWMHLSKTAARRTG